MTSNDESGCPHVRIHIPQDFLLSGFSMIDNDLADAVKKSPLLLARQLTVVAAGLVQVPGLPVIAGCSSTVAPCGVNFASIRPA